AVEDGGGEGWARRLDPALDADPFVRASVDDVREVGDETGVRHRGAHRSMGRISVGHSRLIHDKAEEVLHRVLVRLPRLPVLELVEEDVVRMELDRRLAIPGVDCDFIADVIQGEVPRAPQSDLAKLAATATASHDLVHPMHRRGEDLRDLVDGRRGRVRETHYGRRIAARDPVEDLGGQVVDLPMDDLIDSELLLHPVAAIEMPYAGSAEDNRILPIRPLHPPNEVENHR